VRKRKFDEKSIKTILVGYEPNGYKLWNEESRKFMIARDVVVDEKSIKSMTLNENKEERCSRVPRLSDTRYSAKGTRGNRDMQAAKRD